MKIGPYAVADILEGSEALQKYQDYIKSEAHKLSKESALSDFYKAYGLEKLPEHVQTAAVAKYMDSPRWDAPTQAHYNKAAKSFRSVKLLAMWMILSANPDVSRQEIMSAVDAAITQENYIEIYKQLCAEMK